MPSGGRRDRGFRQFQLGKRKIRRAVHAGRSYHGVTYTEGFRQGAAYITKARVQLMRDFGMYPPRRMRFC